MRLLFGWVFPLLKSLALFIAISTVAFSSQTTVSWDDNSTAETGFKIERSSDGVTFFPLGTVSANVTTYIDASVTAGSTYWYRICAFNATSTSAYSNLASFSTEADKPPTVPAEVAKPAETIPSHVAHFSVQAVSAPWGSAATTVNFSVGGKSKTILLRAVGPGLDPYTTAATLTDPKINLLAGSTLVATNNNWGGSTLLSSTFDRVGAFPLKSTSKDAALLTSVAPESYAVTIQGGKAGMALVELYDADTATTPEGRLTQISARAPVGKGEAVLVGGFTISGDAPMRLLVRAIGPSLSGLQGILSNPQLHLYRGSTEVTANDNWGGTSSLKALFAAVGASTLSSTSKDAAVDVSLAPGNYTAVISGVNGATGIARLELYVVP
jgi:hypothetical protein